MMSIYKSLILKLFSSSLSIIYNVVMNYKFEVCCGSIRDGIVAYKKGANRIEINCALELGGLTPQITTIKYLKENIDIPIVAMLRLRGSNFIYTEEEFFQMKLDVIELLKSGVDGIVFGSLNKDRTINKSQVKYICNLTHKYGKKFIFHKAIDETVDIDKAFEDLIAIGVDRVLTSGGKANVLEGLDKLKYLLNKYGEKIDILAGGGVNKDNITLLKDIGINQFHAGCKEIISDDNTKYDSSYIRVDAKKVKELVNIIKNF